MALEKGVKRKGQKGDFLDAALISAVSHQVRVDCLGILFERVASPSELAEELDLPIQNVSYHVGELEKLGCIELVRTEKKRSIEHFYRIIERPLIDADTWARVPRKDQVALTAGLLRVIGEDVNKAMALGTVNDDDNHISRTPMTVDREGWEEVRDELEETLGRLLEIESRSARRRAKPDADPDDSIPIKVEILHFRSPKKR